MLRTPPPAIRARVSLWEADERDSIRAHRRLGMPSPAPSVAIIATGLLEVEAGLRPGHQLERLCHPTLWDSLEGTLRHGSGPAVSRGSLRRVLVQEDTLGLADGVALLQRGDRLEPVAMRLDAADGQWRLVELQYLPARTWPDQGRVAA
jgi:Family of unknown function (DUF6459)